MIRHISRRTVQAQDVVGELFLPAGPGPFPAVVCIGGSSGGVQSAIASLLAAEGLAALSLGYFGAPGLPDVFAHLPLETFVRGVDWLLGQPMIRGHRAGVTGTSRGSEAALQLAALTPRVGAVVAYVPSGIRWMGVEGQPPWTYWGRPLPYVSWANDFAGQGALAKVDRFNHVLDDPAAFAAAEIAVERAACPMFLISGQDDQLWPSARMAELIVGRLKRHGYAYPYRHLSYPHAGHRIKVPGLPPSRYEPISEDTVTHELLQLGGTAAGNKAASEQSWREVVAFLHQTLAV